MDYLALLILLPVSVNVALAGDAILQSPNMMNHINSLIPAEWAVRMLLNLLPFLVVILSLTAMYLFIPHTKVKTYAAFTGALFAGFFWSLIQKFYIILQIGVAKYNAIYGSFATVPLFLIWLHIGWTFVLLGGSLAYAVQNRNLYHLPGAGISPQRNLQLAFDILDIVYHHFSEKKETSFDDLVRENQGELPGEIQIITEKLLKGGLIHQVNDNLTFLPASPAENIEAREVVRLILGYEQIPTPGGEFSQQVLQAAEQAIPAEAFPRAVTQKNPVHIQNTNNPDQAENHGQDEKTL
jgi:membrane protein